MNKELFTFEQLSCTVSLPWSSTHYHIILLIQDPCWYTTQMIEWLPTTRVNPMWLVEEPGLDRAAPYTRRAMPWPVPGPTTLCCTTGTNSKTFCWVVPTLRHYYTCVGVMVMVCSFQGWISPLFHQYLLSMLQFKKDYGTIRKMKMMAIICKINYLLFQSKTSFSW